MTCRSCGHTIADNAIVCYKCGAPTAIPEVKRPAAPASGVDRSIGLLVVTCLLLAVQLVFAALAPGSWIRWAGCGLAVVLVALAVHARRR